MKYKELLRLALTCFEVAQDNNIVVRKDFFEAIDDAMRRNSKKDIEKILFELFEELNKAVEKEDDFVSELKDIFNNIINRLENI